MGLMDRDYMHERHRQAPPRERPFSPPPERRGLETVGMVLVFVALLFFLYKAAQWRLRPRPAAQSSAPVTINAPKREAPAWPSATAPAPLVQPVLPSPASQTVRVTKCVLNGKTSYGDDTCPQGAQASQVVTRSQHNLMAAVRTPSPSPSPAEAAADLPTRQRSVATPAPGTALSDAALRASECERLDSRIAYLDSLARQPQTASMQDWLRDQRQKARDRQFALRCR